MLKLIFTILLGLNGLLLAAYLSNVGAEQREPARLKNQLNADQMRLISAASAQAAAAPPPPPPEPPNTPKAPEIIACTEVGNFVLADARRFENRVADLDLGDRQARRNVPGQDVSSYIVYIPAPGSKEGIDKKVAELKQRGVTSYFVIADAASPQRGAISLGVFKLETGAQELLASLNKQGVHSAKISPRYGSSKQVAFQFRELDGETKAKLDAIKAGFPAQEMRSCK